MFREVHALPLLRSANGGDLAKAFVATFSVLKLLAPSVIDQVREDAATGGFDKVRERLLRSLRNSGDKETDATVIDAPSAFRSPGKLSRADWKSVAATYPTQRAAVEATGFDPKTITKYLTQHRIPNPWKVDRPS